ncbi:MAG: FAD:protein FMN transferase [Phycisphaerales bacterium]
MHVLWRLFALLALTSLLGACATPPPEERFEFTRICMGVAARIVTYSPDRETAVSGAAAAFEVLGELDGRFSDYRSDSELIVLCSKAGGPAVKVSPELLEVLLAAEELSEKTEGAFDITVGPAVRLWREARRTGKLPEAAALGRARWLIGWRMVNVDRAAGTVRLERAGMLLDLGGIAKGFAAERAVRALEARGLPRSMVSLAGDIAVGDAPPGEAGWRIGVNGEQWTGEATGAKAVTGRDDGGETLVLTNVCVSTSGDTEQFVEIEGRRYSHIIDPFTGIGTAGGVSVTVVHPSGAVADALPTAACVIGTGVIGRFDYRMAIIEWRSEKGVQRSVWRPGVFDIPF